LSRQPRDDYVALSGRRIFPARKDPCAKSEYPSSFITSLRARR